MPRQPTLGDRVLQEAARSGNGPFILDEYVPGDRIVMKANPSYYGTKPKLAKVIQKIVPDAASGSC